MKIKELKDLKTKETKALAKMVSEKKLEVVKKKVGIFAAKEKNLKVAQNLKREIAQILTIIREKEILEKIEKKEELKK